MINFEIKALKAVMNRLLKISVETDTDSEGIELLKKINRAYPYLYKAVKELQKETPQRP